MLENYLSKILNQFDMMRAIFFVLFLAFSLSLSAQGGKDIYNRYSGKKGVSAVYISPAMFDLMKELPDIEVENGEVNLGGIIRTFDGMYILNIQDQELSSRLYSDISAMVRRGSYKLLMEAVEDGQEMHIYIVRDGDVVTDFLLAAREGGTSVSVISITGRMPMSGLQKILADAAD